MNPTQLRETTIDPRTRRLVQLTIDGKDNTDQLMDMLLAKKRAADRREWLEEKGNLARSAGLDVPENQELNFEGVERQPLRHLHREGLPRLLDVRDPRPRAAGARRRPEAGAAAHHLCDERARAVGRLQAQEVRAHRRRCHRQVPPARRLACYEAMVLMAQPFAYRYPIVDGQGNWGSQDDPEVLRRHALHRGASSPSTPTCCSGSSSHGTVDWTPTSTARWRSR